MFRSSTFYAAHLKAAATRQRRRPLASAAFSPTYLSFVRGVVSPCSSSSASEECHGASSPSTRREFCTLVTESWSKPNSLKRKGPWSQLHKTRVSPAAQQRVLSVSVLASYSSKSGHQTGEGISPPSKFRLLSDDSKQKLLESPVGSLSNEDLQTLRDAYQRGHHLVQQEQLERNQTLHSQGKEREFRRHKPLGRKRGPLPPRSERGDLVLDWPYLTDLVQEGWLILDRVLAELEHQQTKKTATLSSSSSTQSTQQQEPFNSLDPINRENIWLPWALQTWRMIYLYEIPENEPCHQRLLTPEQVYPRLRSLLDLNMFLWSCHLVNFVLDVIEHRTATMNNFKTDGNAQSRLRESACLGQDVFDALVEIEPPRDAAAQHHLPDRELISKLVSMWNRSLDVEAPNRVMHLLQLLECAHQFEPNSDKFAPDAFVYNAVLRCWTQTPLSFDPQNLLTEDDLFLADQRIKNAAGPVALRLLEEGQEKYGVQMTNTLYDTVLKCLMRAEGVYSQQQVLTLLEERVSRWKKAFRLAKRVRGTPRDIWRNEENKRRFRPTSNAYMFLLHSFVRRGQTHQAVDLMERMDALATETSEEDIRPPLAAYEIVQKALNRKVQAHGSDHKRYPVLEWSSYSPNTFLSWEKEAMDTWAQIKMDLAHPLDSNEDPAMAIRDAFALLDTVAARCFRHPMHVSHNFLPWPREVLTIVISSWKHLRRKVRNGQNTNQNDNRWGSECRAPRVEAAWLLNRLNNYVAVGLFRPTGENLDFMFELIEKVSGNEGYTAHIFAEALLKYLIVRHRGHYSEDPDCPDAFAMRRAMKLWRNAVQYNETPEESRAEIEGGERIVKRLFRWYERCGQERYRPNAEICSYLIEIWIESLSHVDPHAVSRRASEIFEQWKRLGTERDEVPADVEKLYHIVSRARALKSTPAEAQKQFDRLILKCRDGNHNLMDPESLFVSLIQTLGRAGEPALVLDCISKMNVLFKDIGDTRLQPKTSCYNALIEAYGLAGDLVKVEAILHSLLKPKLVGEGHSNQAVFADLDSWNKVLEAWSISGSQEAPSRAAELLQQLETNTEFLPNLETLNLVMKCFLNAKDPHSFLNEAQALLERMETEAASPKPNRETYLNYMLLTKACDMPDETVRALNSFCELCENGTIHHGPDVRHFNTAIQAHANFKSDTEKAFPKAMAVFHRMTDASFIFQKMSTEMERFNAEPDACTYESLLEVALGSSDSVKDQMSDSEAVVEAILQQKWHVNPVNKDQALKIFCSVLDYWKEKGSAEGAEGYAEWMSQVRTIVNDLKQGNEKGKGDQGQAAEEPARKRPVPKDVKTLRELLS